MITDDLDRAFIPYIYSNKVSGMIIQGSDSAILSAVLKGKEVPGTIFNGTI